MEKGSKAQGKINLKDANIERLAKMLGIDIAQLEEQANKQVGSITSQLEKLNERIEKIENFQNDMKGLAKKYGVNLSAPNPSPNPNPNPNPQTQMIPQVQNPQVPPAQYPQNPQDNPILAMLIQAMMGGSKPMGMEKLMARVLARNMLMGDYLMRGFLKRFGDTEFKAYLKELGKTEEELGVKGMEYVE